MPKGTKHSYFNEKGCAHKSTSFFYALSPGKENPPSTAGVNRGLRVMFKIFLSHLRSRSRSWSRLFRIGSLKVDAIS